MGATQALPEGFQSVPALAVADEHDSSGEEIEHDGQVTLPLADVDFIDGDLLELVELGLAEAALQMLGLHLLNGVSTDQQMGGDILDGHVPREFQGITFEGTGVVFLGVGEVDFDLAGLATRGAVDAWQLEFEARRL